MASAHLSPTWVFEPVHSLFTPPVSGTIPDIWPVTSPAKVRFCDQFPCAITGEGEAAGFTFVDSQAVAKTMRATMPATRSMWSNVSRDSRLGTNHPSDEGSGSSFLDRGRRCDRNL